VSVAEAAACLRVLRRATGPLVAATIAGQMGLAGRRESLRRRVRAIIKHLRDRDGCWIVATLMGGYWLTEEADVWKDYQEGRKIEAKRLIGEAARRQRIIAGAGGQGLLFGPRAGAGIGD
jgi:hypothetical protein